ncbi:MAG: Na/Pi cotransporter family protein [Pseudomonadales bacterium]|nr:Na/Pi cotransporter family protein [Pseudomonadales bacterium]
MENIHILMAGLTAVVLFVFGLESFSKEIERISGDRFRKTLGSATRIPILGVLIGAVVTAFIQSSSATSVITISLVNAGVLSFKNSVGIIFGANVGTTITAQLVAFKLTAFAPVFILFGFLLTIIKTRFSIFGKTVFYFGFVFFSLNLIASSLQPLQQNQSFMQLLTQPYNPLFAILMGCLFTAIVQSSSVTTGLAIIFTQQGLLSLENAVPLIMGANIGTTATALISVFNMDIAAKKTALCHFFFNVGGVLLFLPLLFLYGGKLNDVAMDPAIALANIHLVFNVVASLFFLLFITPFTNLIDRLMGEGKMDFKRLELPVYSEEEDFSEIRKKLESEAVDLFYFLQENYNVVSLSVETNYKGVFDVAGKRLEYMQFVKKDYLAYFSRIVTRISDESDSRELIRLITQFDYLFQIHDSIKDIFDAKRVMQENYIELNSDILLLIRDISSQTLNLFDDIHKSLPQGAEPFDIRTQSRQMQYHLDDATRQLLSFLADPVRRDAGALTNFVTYSQRLKDKLINFAELRFRNKLQIQDKDAAHAEALL